MKRVGGAFLFIGFLVTLCVALIKPRLGLIDKKLTQTEGQIQGSQAPIAPPPVTLAVARQEIPEALKKIYAALNDGQPQNAANRSLT